MNAWKQQDEDKGIDEEDAKKYQDDIEAVLSSDPDPEPWEEGCCGLVASPWLIRARAVALETFNKDEAAEAASQYNSYFTFATLLLGFEGFILSDYLKNDPGNPNPFDKKLSWAVFLIMWSFVVNVFISVVTLHMAKTTSARTYEPWHRAYMPLSQWGCRFSVVLFSIGINLIVSESTGLTDGYKIAIYTMTGVGFVWACFIYLTVWFGPTDRIIAHCVPHNKLGDCCCSFLTGTTPLDNDLLEIHAAGLKEQVQKEMLIEQERVKRWRAKKRKELEAWKEDARQTAMATLRRAHLPADFLASHHAHNDSTDSAPAVPEGKDKDVDGVDGEENL